MVFSGQYLTYAEYQALGGTLDQMPFNLLEYEARKIIDGRTQNRVNGLTTIPEEVKLCVNAMISSMQSYISSSQNKNVASETIDGYSVSYISPSDIAEVVKVKQVEMETIMFNYLVSTGLLYLGVC